MPEEQSLRVALPESLRQQFAHLEKRLRSVETAVAAALSTVLIFGSYLLLFIIDRFFSAPVVLRSVLFAVAAGGCALVWGWWSMRWLLRQRSLRELAMLVQRRHRRLGDRLLGIVELADEEKRPENFSAELYSAAIRQVSEESRKYDFNEAVNSSLARRNSSIAAVLLILVILPALILPEASWNAFRRWIAPFAGIPRFTLVNIAGLDLEKIVPRGENFEVAARVEYRSFWHPIRARGLINGQPPIHSPVNGTELKLQVPGQVENGVLKIRLGDAERSVAIRPENRPGLEKVSAEVGLPEYLGYPPRMENLQGGAINVLEGGQVAVHGEVSRPLSAAYVIVGDQPPQSLSISGSGFTTPSFPAESISKLAFTWRDTLGLTNAAPFTLNVNTIKDAAPIPEFPDIFRDTAILESEVFPIQIRVRDDFGVKFAGLEWQLQGADSGTNSAAPNTNQFFFQVQGTTEATLEHAFNFSPAVLRIPADSTVEIRGYAVDYLPGRERTETPTYRIHVMGTALHAEMIRQNLESLLVRVEEVTRMEERIAAETRDLKDLQKLDSAEASDKIAELAKLQDQNAAQLQEVAEEGMKTLREALRNPAFTEQMLSEWTKNLHDMQEISEQQMQQASQSMKSAGQQSDQAGREQSLAESLEKQQESIDQLQQMQRQVNEGLDEMQALTLAQRLRKVGSEQKKIEGHLQKSIADTVGLTPQELPPRYQKANSTLATMQSDSHGQSAELQGEISRFYERTQKPNYGEVSKEMTELRPGEEMERIRGLIQENIGMEAMNNLATWADKFNSWADKLEPKESGDSGSGGSGSGQGGGQQENPALKQLLALLRMRERQVNIQDRTGLLHAYIEEQTTYRDGAVLLAASQAKLNQDLTKQAVENAFALLEAPYNETLTSMSDVENLLDKPRTDEVTKTAQDKSVSMLSDLINLLNEQAKQSGNSSQGQGSSSEEMAFLMQMMAPQLSPGMQAGQTAGGSMSGGDTDRTDGAPVGDSAGGPPDARTVGKASGVPQNYPTEFRPALEKYFKALEQAEQ